jgi:hypothetical protein
MFISKIKPQSLLGIALLASTVTVNWQTAASAQQDDITALLEQTVEIMNKGLPTIIEPGIQWDSSVAGPGKKLTYNYTMMNYKSADLEGTEFASYVSESITNEVCSNPMTQIFPENGVLLSFNVYDNTHNLITQVEVADSDCNY